MGHPGGPGHPGGGFFPGTAPEPSFAGRTTIFWTVLALVSRGPFSGCLSLKPRRLKRAFQSNSGEPGRFDKINEEIRNEVAKQALPILANPGNGVREFQFPKSLQGTLA